MDEAERCHIFGVHSSAVRNCWWIEPYSDADDCDLLTDQPDTDNQTEAPLLSAEVVLVTPEYDIGLPTIEELFSK